MPLDVRIPIGLLFSIVGLALTVFGAIGDPAIYRQSLGVNVNLIWGIVLLVFGVLMLLAGRRSSARSDT